jgi:hypothetical protein
LIAEAIEGRTSNVTFNTDGGLVTTRALDVLLAQIPEIRDYHLEQNSRTYYELQVMLSESSSWVLDQIRQTLISLYGRGGRYEIKVLPNILPGPAGKFRRTQTNFTFDMKGLFV